MANKTASNYGQHISITFWQLPEDYSQEILILLQIEFCSLYIATYGETGVCCHQVCSCDCMWHCVSSITGLATVDPDPIIGHNEHTHVIYKALPYKI